MTCMNSTTKFFLTFAVGLALMLVLTGLGHGFIGIALFAAAFFFAINRRYFDGACPSCGSWLTTKRGPCASFDTHRPVVHVHTDRVCLPCGHSWQVGYKEMSREDYSALNAPWWEVRTRR